MLEVSNMPENPGGSGNRISCPVKYFSSTVLNEWQICWKQIVSDEESSEFTAYVNTHKKILYSCTNSLYTENIS